MRASSSLCRRMRPRLQQRAVGLGPSSDNLAAIGCDDPLAATAALVEEVIDEVPVAGY